MEPQRAPSSFRPLFASPGPKAASQPHTSGFRIPGYKDAALIIAGFSVLLLAPMVEYYVASPRNDREVLKSGLNFRGGDLSDAGVFEDGIAGIAPGGLLGQGANVSPLNASDPTALILRFWNGEEEEQAEPRPKPRPPRRAEPDGWKNALSAAVRRGVSRGAASARRPTPAGRLASRLSGFSSGAQGGSRAAAMPQLSAPTYSGLLSEKNAERPSLSRVQVSTDFRGAWRSGSAGAGGGAGSGSSSGFLQSNRTLQSPDGGMPRDGTGIPGVDGSALSRQSSGGGGDLSRGGDAEKISLTSAKDDRKISIDKKEDLSYERRKMEMQKAIELKWEKRKYDEIERKKMLEQIAAQTASQALLKVLDSLLQGKQKGEGGGG